MAVEQRVEGVRVTVAVQTHQVVVGYLFHWEVS